MEADKTATTIRINRWIPTISNEMTHSNLSIRCKKNGSRYFQVTCVQRNLFLTYRGKLVFSKLNINLWRHWCFRIVEISWEPLFHRAPPAFPSFTGRTVWQPYEATLPVAEAGNRTVLCSSLWGKLINVYFWELWLVKVFVWVSCIFFFILYFIFTP